MELDPVLLEHAPEYAAHLRAEDVLRGLALHANNRDVVFLPGEEIRALHADEATAYDYDLAWRRAKGVYDGLGML